MLQLLIFWAFLLSMGISYGVGAHGVRERSLRFSSFSFCVFVVLLFSFVQEHITVICRTHGESCSNPICTARPKLLDEPWTDHPIHKILCMPFSNGHLPGRVTSCSGEFQHERPTPLPHKKSHGHDIYDF